MREGREEGGRESNVSRAEVEAHSERARPSRRDVVRLEGERDEEHTSESCWLGRLEGLVSHFVYVMRQRVG